MHADVDVVAEFEIGLELPDGTQIFPPETFRGRSLATPEDRKVIHDSLLVAMDNMGYPRSRALEDYHWVRRETEVVTIRRSIAINRLAIDDGFVISSPESADAIVENETSGPPGPDGDSG
ncbi:hypothetical protein SEA_COLT_81 [Mycobacterium phage Colt]|uniref:Uncharacterized protein n=1 Tax=Mycobacterium phage Cane17 TaxID=2301548 RepID=A0A346N8Q5_9CAUD|nr:hypothetical protein KHO59_gp219 [Mycobacterium phage Cane17]AXQ51690.1 hypothetical protein SEA_CANE17_80 [Mycobacterium phage Cane17]QAY14025.1 hypothetical protein SEA_COLT_81 [Mycobacterium phage Colt]